MTPLRIKLESASGNPYIVSIDIEDSWHKYWESTPIQTQFYQALADQVINQAYVDVPSDFIQSHGAIIFRPNHDVGHGLRQVANSVFLFVVINSIGHSHMKASLKELTPQELAATYLAAYLFRAARTNEHGSIIDSSHAGRSATVFSKIAKAIGFDTHLVDNIAYGIENFGSFMDEEYSQKLPFNGYHGHVALQKEKSRLVKTVLDVGHHSDLVRCWDDVDLIRPNNLQNLRGLLKVDDINAFNDVLLNFARACNAITGSPYYKEEDKLLRFVPPFQLRIETAFAVSNTLDKLSDMVNTYVPMALENQVESSQKKLRAIEDGVNQETEDSNAVNTIQRAFRINRAHKITKQAVGIVPAQVSAENLQGLKQRLRECHGKQSSDINEQGLLVEEMSLYNYLVNDFNWVLKHITDQMPLIQQNGNALKSIHQRSREGQVNEFRHTSYWQGRSDNIFFSISSPSGRGAHFLQLVRGHEIRVPLRSFMNQKGSLVDKLSGLWLSSAWYGYTQNYKIHSKVDDVKRQVGFVKNHPEDYLIDKEDYKEYQWEYSDGQKVVKQIPFGKETVSGEDIVPFLALNTLYELRHASDDFRRCCLNNPKSSMVEAFVDMIYDVHSFEALLPATLPLNDSRIEIKPLNQDDDLSEDFRLKMRKAIDGNKVNKLQALIQQGCPVDIQIKQYETALGYSLLKNISFGNKRGSSCALHLINNGANISALINKDSILTLAVFNLDYPVVKALLSKGYHDSRTKRVLSYLDINSDENAVMAAILNQDLMMLKLLHEYGLVISSMPKKSLITLAKMSEQKALPIVKYMIKHGFRCDPRNPHEELTVFRALKTCMKHQRYQLLQEMLQAGHWQSVDYGIRLNQLLRYAHQLGDEKVLSFMKQAGFDEQKADKNQRVHIYLKVTDNQSRTLVLKKRRLDGSMSSFWQSIDYIDDDFSLSRLKLALLTYTGLRPNNYEINHLLEDSFEDDIKSYVVELNIRDEKPAALDTDYFGQPRWLSPQDTKVPLSKLSRCLVLNQPTDKLKQAFSEQKNLFEAVRTQNDSLLQASLKANAVDEDQLALFSACDQRTTNLNLINTLLKHGYDVNAVDDSLGEPMTALMYAILHNNKSLVQYLLAHRAQPNQAVGKFKVTPLMFAAQDNNLELMKVLQNHGADYHHPANKGVLAFAMRRLCSDETFNYLVQRADCNGVYFQLSPLLIAVKNCDDERIKRLLEHHADITIKDPITRESLSILYKGDDYGLRSLLQDNEKKNQGFEDVSDDYRVYLKGSGALDRNQVDDELAIEYLLTMVNKVNHKELHCFVMNIVEQCQLQDMDEPPMFAIAHEGSSYVRTCAGFSQPVIAIHHEFFKNESLDFEHLAFAIAHELFLLDKRGQRQFNQVSQYDRMQADKKVLELFPKKDEIAFDYLQKEHEFNRRHDSLNIHEKPDYFYWPIVYSVMVEHGFIPERLKGVKVASNLNPSLVLNQKALTLSKDIRDKIFEEVQSCKAFNYFPDYSNLKGSRAQLDYLKDQLGGLSEEFISYVLVNKLRSERLASQKVKQFCALVKKSQFNDDMMHELVYALEKAGVHSFSYIYSAIVGISPVLTVGHRTRTPLKPLGSFNEMHQALDAFKMACEAKNTFLQVLEAARKVLEIYPIILPHVEGTSVNGDIIESFIKSFENYSYEKLQGLRVESEVASMIEWPVLESFDCAKDYLKQDIDHCILKVLWMMGFYKNEALYEQIPESLIRTLANSKEYGDLAKQGFEVFPFCDHRSSYAYPNDVSPIARTYLERYAKPDVSMLKGDFLGESDAFFKANSPILENPNNQHHQVLVELFAEKITDLLKGNAVEQDFALSLYGINQVVFSILSNSLQSLDTHPLGKALLENAHHTQVYRLYNIIRHFDDDESKYRNIKKYLTLDGDGHDEFSNLVALTDFVLTREFRNASVDMYWRPFLIKCPKLTFDYQLMRVLERFNELECTTVISGAISFEGVDFTELPLLDCIILYRILDRDFELTDEGLREALTSRIRQGLNVISDLNQRIFFLQQLIFTKKSPSCFVLTDKVFLSELNQRLGQSYAQKHGMDDGTKVYFKKVESTLERVFSNTHAKDGIDIFSCFADEVLSQALVSRRLEQLLEPDLHAGYARRSTNLYANLTRVFSHLGRDFDDKGALLRFLSAPLTELSLQAFVKHLGQHRFRDIILKHLDIKKDTLNQDQSKMALRMIYQSFWGLSLKERAVLLDSLLITTEEETKSQSSLKAYRFGFDFLMNILFPKAESDEREAFAFSLLSSYLTVADDFERQFLLSGLLVTSNESSAQKGTIGHKLALICEHMGPAYVKLAQAIHSHPDTPDDIKQDLSHIKGRANPPHRWQLWRHLGSTLPEAVFNDIHHLGKLLGSASYNLAIECHYQDNRDMVLTLLRENAELDAKKGFKHLEKTIAHCSHELIEKSKDTFISSIDEARTLSDWEINNDVSNIQYKHAKGLYNNITEKVELNQKVYFVHFRACENIANGPGYKMLTRMPGDEFNELKDETLKQAIAKVVWKKELAVLLSGGVFDSDRHGCQYRVTVEKYHIHLGLYDFGEMSIEPLKDEEIESYARLVEALPNTLQTNGSIPDLFQEHIKQAIEEDRPYRHLMRVNKALLALNDFSQYLSPYDMKLIIRSIQSDIHPTLRQALRRGWLQSASYTEVFSTIASTLSTVLTDTVQDYVAKYRNVLFNWGSKREPDNSYVTATKRARPRF